MAVANLHRNKDLIEKRGKNTQKLTRIREKVECRGVSRVGDCGLAEDGGRGEIWMHVVLSVVLVWMRENQPMDAAHRRHQDDDVVVSFVDRDPI